MNDNPIPGTQGPRKVAGMVYLALAVALVLGVWRAGSAVYGLTAELRQIANYVRVVKLIAHE
ncbi:MAG: hypothetical protein KJZ83_00525 [Burkholderiaceae bacterium]|nr:hypothetical protein [Burkholderiaceae bacterium]